MQPERIKITSPELNLLFTYGFVTTIESNGQIGNTINVLEKGDIHINNYIFYTGDESDFTINIDNTSSKILIEHAQFENKFSISGKIQNEVIFDNVTFIKDVHVSLDCKNLSIANCQVMKLMGIAGNYKALSIAAGAFTHLQVMMSQSQSVRVDKTTVNEGLAFEGGTTGTVEISGCDINYLIIQLANLGKLYLGDYSNVKNLQYGNCRTGSVFIAHSSVSSIGFGSDKIQFFRAEKSTFKGMVVVNYSRNHGNVYLKDCSVDQLTAHGKMTGSLEIYECDFNKIFFVDLFNGGDINISRLRINPGGILSIKKSNLGKAQIHESDLAHAQFHFEKSQVNEIFISETDFPDKVYLNDKINYGQSKLAFGQLQTVFQKQGDSIRSNEYLSREIESHYREIPIFSNMFFTKLNLAFNHWSNDFGRSWSRGVVFTLSIGFLFFYLLILSSKQYSLAFQMDWNWGLLGPYLRFINPLRHFETETLFSNAASNEITLSNLSYFWDFLGRIFVAYGYYQTIQAFRKFGRK